MILLALSLLSLGIWAYLLFGRGWFWRADQRLPEATPASQWPPVTAIIPARNEVDHINDAVCSLLAQDYPGELSVIVVDDDSSDGTAATARAAAGDDPRLSVISGRPLDPAWTGKLWALGQGIAAAGEGGGAPRYLLLTDADIHHQPSTLRRLVAKAENEGRALVSLMVLLRAESLWEKLLIPAFVFFFQKLYPFPRVNDAARPEAAAAGGCILVRRDALETCGGLDAIRDRIIDDCALAALLKGRGYPIWLGLADAERSLRAYGSLAEIWTMVSRTAFVQLEHSLFNLVGTVLGMVLIYLVPPALTIAGLIDDTVGPLTWAAAGTAWMAMALAFAPTLRLYGQWPLWSLLLPVAGLLYTLMTLDSARRHWQGRGSAWKGRTYSKA